MDAIKEDVIKITCIKTGLFKYEFEEDFSAKDFNRIIEFYINHPDYEVDLVE